jgi:CubicO group peptidase (beta-lactamase class C family)
MIVRKFGYTFLLFVLLLSGFRKDEVITSLPRSVPEAEGVSSQGIIDFLNAAAKSRNEFHSFMFLRHGKVIAEGWWNPYKPEIKHSLYSASKSFTATAVGLAVSEKRLSVNDKVISFFPKELPDSVSPYLSNMTVKDLLIMSTGQGSDPTRKIVANETNWVKAFLATPLVRNPGTKFLYNSMATYMLSAIVQKVTGEKVIDYLKPRLFKPLNIEGMDWEIDPTGINTGGWGLRLKTEDMAKFGQLFLQKGKWNGNQVVPAAWIEEATTSKIDQAPDAPPAKKDSSDLMQGYCYQMWRCRHNCYRADGAFGQFIIVMPDQDAVVAITCEASDTQNEINLVWNYLLPSIKSEKLPQNSGLNKTLKKKLSSLELPLPGEANSSVAASEISGKTFGFEPNDKHMETMNFRFKDKICQISMMINSIRYNFSLGAGKWIIGETTLPGPNLLMLAKAHLAGIPPVKVAGSFYWRNENTLDLVLRYIESPHTETITCKFDKNMVLVDYHYSKPDNVQSQLKGVVKD